MDAMMVRWSRMTPKYTIGLYHPLHGVTNPKYKLFYSLTTKFFSQREEGTSFWPRQVLPSSALFTVDSLPFLNLTNRKNRQTQDQQKKLSQAG